MSRFPVEPANTASNLIFLAILFVLLARMRRESVRSRFLTMTLAILFVGWVGGTLYHATRSSFLWLTLDYVPILMLGLLGSLRLIFALDERIKLRFALVALPSLGLGWTTAQRLFDGPTRISVSYGFFAVLLCVPAVIHSRSRGWLGIRSLLLAMTAFAVALGCRIQDAALVTDTPRLGTHFLWHLFGGVAAWFLLDYLYRAESPAPGNAATIR